MTVEWRALKKKKKNFQRVEKKRKFFSFPLARTRESSYLIFLEGSNKKIHELLPAPTIKCLLPEERKVIMRLRGVFPLLRLSRSDDSGF